LIPMEARALAKNCMILVNNVGGLGTQITDGYDGFSCSCGIELDELFNPKRMHDITEAAQKLKYMIDLESTKKLKIIDNGKKTVYDKYNFNKNFILFLNKIYPSIISNEIIPFNFRESNNQENAYNDIWLDNE